MSFLGSVMSDFANAATEFVTDLAEDVTGIDLSPDDPDLAAVLNDDVDLDALPADPSTIIADATVDKHLMPIDPPSGDAPNGDSEGGLGAMEFSGDNGSMSVDEMREAMNENPEEMMNFLDGLSAEDRQMAMQMMNQRMQQINQMFSMMSNMMKVQHDTAKSAINNIRV